MKILTENNKQTINFYGHNGVFNKKLVNEVANYLRMRYYFPNGIFWLHSNSKCFRADFDNMCSSLQQNKSMDNKNKHKNRQVNKPDKYHKKATGINPPKNNCLIIVDMD